MMGWGRHKRQGKERWVERERAVQKGNAERELKERVYADFKGRAHREPKRQNSIEISHFASYSLARVLTGR